MLPQAAAQKLHGRVRGKGRQRVVSPPAVARMRRSPAAAAARTPPGVREGVLRALLTLGPLHRGTVCWEPFWGTPLVPSHLGPSTQALLPTMPDSSQFPSTCSSAPLVFECSSVAC